VGRILATGIIIVLYKAILYGFATQTKYLLIQKISLEEEEMPIIFTRPVGGGGDVASEIINDSSVAGASVKDDLDWLDQNKVDYNFGGNTISGTGDIYAGSYYGDGSNLTGIPTYSGVINVFKYNQYLATVSGMQVYSLPDLPVDETQQIYLNGLLQEPGEDYVISGQIVSFIVAIDLGDVLLASYIVQ